MFLIKKHQKKSNKEKDFYFIAFTNFRNKVNKEYDFQIQEINNYIFNTKSHQTSIFKEYLFTDDSSKEYFKRYS